MTSSLLPILPVVDDVLFNFAQSDGFWANLETAFGASYDVVKATELQQQWKSRNFGQIPPIEVLSDEVLGTAKGAYSSSTNKIYLSASFLNTASSAAIVNVILEEIGHYVDAQINQVDSAGDEGAIFAELVQGNSLDVATLDALRGENDQTTIIVNGESIQVEQADFTGTNGNDNITGTSGDDNISGLDGNDTLSGLGGNDNIYGGNGNDSVNGDAGDDVLYSDAGNDTLNGGTGFDYYVANYSDRTTGLTMTYDPATGNGSITIGTEIDTFTSIDSFNVYGGFRGTAFADVIVGTSANEDWWGIYGGDGNDNISGGAGNDKLFGEEGNDTLNGGSGNDELYGGNGNDVVNGDAGDDVLYSDAGSDTLNGGTGFDYYVANYSDRTTGLTMTYDPATGNGSITIGTEIDTFTSIDSFNVYGGFRGTAFADVIVGTSANEDWWGIYGGDGNDNISGGAGNDKLFGEEGNDTLNGGSGNDELYGGNGNDVVNGDAGDDTLYSDAGSDTLNGGTGFDYYVANYSDRTSGLTMTYDSATGNGTIVVGAETDTLISIENFYDFKGTNFDDTIVGSASADYYLSGLAGNDLISGHAGGDWIYGGDGNDTLNGGADNDDLRGETGNDVLNGEAGSDTIYSDAGNDTINGGEGTDTYRGNYSDRTSGLTMTYDSATGNGTIVVGAETDTLISIENFYDFKGTNFDDTIVGSASADYYLSGLAGNDLISSNAGGDWIYGGDGNDTLNGGADNDALYGEAGNDVLNGGDGNDDLSGGEGNDILNGEAGNDNLNGGTGSNTINGGEGTDTYSNNYSDRTSGLTMTYDSATGNGTIVVGTETDTLISIETFYDFKGTNFDDTIVGSASADYYLSGLAGNDPAILILKTKEDKVLLFT